MKLIIPMAGMGTRLRPHTLTTPKPLISVYGKPIVFHLIDEIKKVLQEDIDEIAFVVGKFGDKVEDSLLNVAKDFGSKGKICYQNEPKGTAHAVYCAKEAMDGKVVIAFADTIFKSDLILDSNQDGIVWVKEVEDPSAYGVVTLEDNFVNGFVEKPKGPVSNKAIIGIYYFKDGPGLLRELEYLITNNITVKGEYQLTDALENLRKKNYKIGIGNVDVWMDCGSKETLLKTSNDLLKINGTFFGKNIERKNSSIIEPCYIGENVKISGSVIGPFASIDENSIVTNSVVIDSIIMKNSSVNNICIENSIIGNNCQVNNVPKDVNLGDFSCIKI